MVLALDAGSVAGSRSAKSSEVTDVRIRLLGLVVSLDTSSASAGESRSDSRFDLLRLVSKEASSDEELR